jgi:hypothetical protein
MPHTSQHESLRRITYDGLTHTCKRYATGGLLAVAKPSLDRACLPREQRSWYFIPIHQSSDLETASFCLESRTIDDVELFIASFGPVKRF